MNGLRLVAVMLASLCGSAAGCHLFPRQEAEIVPPPVVFNQPPTLPEVIQAVNSQSDRIVDVQADAARLSVAGFPASLRASLRLERPRRMRLKATLMGNPLLDVGSNDELFWMWTTDSPVLFARHEQFENSVAKQILPVEPTWLIDAMGLIHFDPQGPHQGPYRRQDGGIEIHTRLATRSGERLRVVGIHPQYGYITEVQMRDMQGQLLAVARADRHRHDPIQNVTLPGRVQLELVNSQLPASSFTLEADSYIVNQLQASGSNPNLWAMPPGASQDLADPRLRLPAAPQPGPNWNTPPTADARGFRPEFRGYTRR